MMGRRESGDGGGVVPTLRRCRGDLKTNDKENELNMC